MRKPLAKLSLLFLSFMTLTAMAEPRPIPCPSMDLIKNSKIHLIETQDAPEYVISTTWSGAFRDNGLQWTVLAIDTNTTIDSAYRRVKAAVEGVLAPFRPEAEKFFDIYMCVYASLNGVPVMAWGAERADQKVDVKTIRKHLKI